MTRGCCASSYLISDSCSGTCFCLPYPLLFHLFSALASSEGFPHLSTLLLGPAISSVLLPGSVLVLCSSSFTGIILLLLLFDCFLANLFSFPALIAVPSSLHYLLSLAVAAVDEKQASDTLTPIWYPLCDGHDVYPTLAVDWSAYVFTLASWSKKKTKTNPRHCKSE